MIDQNCDLCGHDPRRLTLPQWTAMRRSILRRAHAERRRLIRSTLRKIMAALGAGWRHLWARQQARATLYAMSDYELRDIGLTRTRIEAAIRDHETAHEAPCRSLHPWRTIMSKAYWIVRVSVRDEARYPEYLAAAKPAFEKFGARFIVRGGAYEVMEGTARDRNVVVEFSDRATASACYRSPEYEAAKAIRQKYADVDFIIIDGA